MLYCLRGTVLKGRTAAPTMTSPKTCQRRTISMVQCNTRHRERKTYEHHAEILHMQPQQTISTPRRQPHLRQKPSLGHSNHTELKDNTNPRNRPANRRHTCNPVHKVHPQVSVINHVRMFDSNLKMAHTGLKLSYRCADKPIFIVPHRKR